uniref:Uncharacterized protein n=1 Tax=Oryza punctata TaxID=4537 RepID=A0A0E0LSI1_ORYPU
MVQVSLIYLPSLLLLVLHSCSFGEALSPIYSVLSVNRKDTSKIIYNGNYYVVESCGFKIDVQFCSF